MGVSWDEKKLERRSWPSCTVVAAQEDGGYDRQRERKMIRQREVGRSPATASVRLTDTQRDIRRETERKKMRDKEKEMRRDSSREGATSRHQTAALQRSGPLSSWPKAPRQP